jgi:phage FluMu protein Com
MQTEVRHTDGSMKTIHKCKACARVLSAEQAGGPQCPHCFAVNVIEPPHTGPNRHERRKARSLARGK